RQHLLLQCSTFAVRLHAIDTRQGRRGMHFPGDNTCCGLRILIGTKQAATVVRLAQVTGQQLVPTITTYPFRQYRIEQAAAYRRQPETFQLLLARRLALTAQPGAAAHPVSLCTAETLLAKIIRHAARGDQRQPRIKIVLALEVTHHQFEIVAAMGAPIELARMPYALQ